MGIGWPVVHAGAVRQSLFGAPGRGAAHGKLRITSASVPGVLLAVTAGRNAQHFSRDQRQAESCAVMQAEVLAELLSPDERRIDAEQSQVAKLHEVRVDRGIFAL